MRDPFLQLLAADTLQVAERAQPADRRQNHVDCRLLLAPPGGFRVASHLARRGGARLPRLWHCTALGRPIQGRNQAVLFDRGRAGQSHHSQTGGPGDPGHLTWLYRAQGPLLRKVLSAPQWEQAEMRTEPGGSAYQFLIAGVPESLEYYVEAGGVRSASYRLNVVDLPSIKNITVTYHYPRGPA